MRRQTPLTVAEREAIYLGKLQGKQLRELADAHGCSYSCARKWWRVGRDQGLDGLRHSPRKRAKSGALSRFDPRIADRALHWKQQHPKRGPTRILVDLVQDPVVAGLRLPKRTALAAFFRQACPALLHKRHARPAAPPVARHVHERWQLDAKEAIRLQDGTLVTVLAVREPVACVCLGVSAHAVQTATAWRKLTFPEIRSDLRRVFTEYGLPAAIQTDRERVYGRPPNEAFPTRFTLWLAGLGIEHHFTRPAQATDQAQVEREHRTLFDWLEQPQPLPDLAALQAALEEARHMHNYVLPSQAGDCQNRPPLRAHPEVLHPLRPYQPAAEVALFDLARMDQFLAQFTWSYKVSTRGQITIAEHAYSVGIAHAGQQVTVRFDPQERHFVFHDSQDGRPLKRRPAKALDAELMTGLDLPPRSTEPLQLSFPW